MNVFARIIKLIVPLIVILYSISVLSLQMLFSIGTQSPYHEKLTFFGFTLPGLITIGFMILAIFEMFLERKNYKTILILLTILGLCEILAIKWQVKFLQWAINKNTISDIIPILIGVITVIIVFIKLIFNAIVANKKKE